MNKNTSKQFEIDMIQHSLKGEPLILDEWLAKMAVNNSKFLETKIRLVVKPRPRLIPRKLWFKLASKFLDIHTLKD